MAAVRAAKSVLTRSGWSGLLVVALLLVLFVATAPAAPDHIYTVNSTSGAASGVCDTTCTLPDAINFANGDNDASQIRFAIPGSGPQTIQLTQALPSITAPLTIDGTTQPNIGASPFGIAIDGGGVTDLVHGQVTTNGVRGLVLAAGSDGSTIRGLALGNFEIHAEPDPAIEVDSSNNAIVGDSIGVAANGTTAAPNQVGILINGNPDGGNSNTIGGTTAAGRNVIVNSFSDSGSLNADGILVEGGGSDFPANNNQILGNYIGLRGDGTTLASNEDSGIQVLDAINTQIGGPQPDDGNVMATDQAENIMLGDDAGPVNGTGSTGEDSLVQNNVLQLSADKQTNYPESSPTAIQVSDRGSNTIEDNTIGETYDGINICNSPDNTIRRNLIGSNTAGLGGPDFGVLDQGITLFSQDPAGCSGQVGTSSDNVIGGAPGDGNVVVGSTLNDVAIQGDAQHPAAGNEVSYNTLRGTRGGADVEIGASGNLIQDNTITGATTGNPQFTPGNGVQVDSGTGNTIRTNSIHGNQSLGIDLGGDGVTPNDPRPDADGGPNSLQNFPVLDQSQTIFGSGGTTLTVAGTLDSAPSTSYDVEFFQSTNGDPSGNGEGASYLGTALVTTDGNGAGSFDTPFPTVSSGTIVTATATAPDGSTSEFSPDVTASGSSSTYVVNTTANLTGGCTDEACALHDAIAAADADGGGTIKFNIPGTGVQTISLTGDLPPITAPITIDGSTQPGYSGTPLIFVSGNQCAECGGFAGLEFDGGSGSFVKGLAIGGFAEEPGIALSSGSSDSTISDSYIGVAPDGTQDANTRGITILNSDGNTIGGTGNGNVISGNVDDGVFASDATGTQLVANRIGVDLGGTHALPNGNIGVELDNTVTTTVKGNVVSGNGAAGVQVTGVTTGTTIQGNRIGTTADGSGALGNTGAGIYLGGVANTTIGGSNSGDGNVISGNSSDGIDDGGDGTQIDGNTIGLTSDGKTALGNGGLGIDLYGGQTHTVQDNVVSANAVAGLLLDGASDTTIVGNLVGTDATGNQARGNGGFGIQVHGGSGTIIGGTGPSDGNVISGNPSAGIEIDGGGGTTIQGNFIGTDATGSSALGNDDDGIYVSVPGNTIGGDGAGAGNVISGNAGSGVHIEGSIANGNTVSGNLIGTDATGTQPLGNKDDGILINAGAANNTIGGTDAGARNVISDNGAAPSLGGGGGVDLRFGPGSGNVVEGNLIGTDSSGSSNLGNAHFGVSIDGSGQTIGGTVAGAGNTIAFNNGPGVVVVSGDENPIRQNSIHDNTGLGIDLSGGNGNDATAAPTITSVVGTQASGTLSGFAANDTVTLEFFGNASCDNVNGAGRDFLGTSAPIQIGQGGTANWNATLSGLGADTGVTATATDGTPDTSQFSDCVTVSSAVNESIAFESNRTGNSQIWTMSPDGSNPVQLTHDASSVTDTLPSISSDGHTIVYQSDASGTNQIWAINGDGSNPRQLTSTGVNTQPTFSPDGAKIAFDSNRSGKFQLFVMNADGSGQTQVTNTNGNVGGSGWSPDGSQIAVNDDSSGTNQIYKVDATSGTESAALTSGGPNTNPHWSPDGSQILYVGGVCTSFCGSESVFLMNADGTNQHNLTNAPIFDADPAWSPDGTQIAFVRDLGGQSFNVFTANADGTNQVRLTFAGQRNSFPNWGTQVSAPSGALSGSVDQSIVQPVDLTATGTRDWALWGYNSTFGAAEPASALTPNETKTSGGREIGNLSITNGDGTPTRGFAFPDPSQVPFNFSWSDGSPDTAVSGGYAGLSVPKLGQGLSFTVPAGPTQRTLTVWTSAHYADETLTAHLSDGSAQDYSQTIQAFAGQFPNSGNNVPATFTLDYHAISPGQHLTVTLTQSANNSCGGCEDAVIYAAALSGGGTASGVSATFGSDASVGMSGSVLTHDLSLSAFDSQPDGISAASINGLQLANTQLANTQLAHTQLANTQLANTQLANTQLANTQLAHTQLANTQLAHTQLANTQLANTQVDDAQLAHTQLAHTQLAHTQLAHTGLTLDTVPLNPTLYPGGWAGLLQGTTLAGQPLQTVSLADVLGLTPADVPHPPGIESAQDVIDKLQSLSFADIELPSSTLGQITVGALALGGATINQLGGDLEDNIETQLQTWCQGFVQSAGAPSTFCGGSDPGVGYLSLIQLALLGAPVDSLQLANTQLANTQLAHTQLANTQLANTQLANTPLSASASGIVEMQLAHTDLTTGNGIDGLFVHDLPSADQTALFYCSTPPSNFDCSTGTLGGAQAAGAIKPGTTLGDLDKGGFLDHVTIQQVLLTVLGPNSAYKNLVNFGDLVGLFIDNNDVPWESVSPDVLAIFDPNRPHMSMEADFTVHGTGTPSADVKVDLPAGFDYVPGSVALLLNHGPSFTPPGEPTINNTTSGVTLDWHLDAVNAESPYELTFQVYGGTTVGPTQATETITAGGQSHSSIASFSVDDSHPGNGTVGGATTIDPTPANESVQMSALPSAGAVDYYTIPMPAAGTRISVHLTNLPADYDLALYSPQSTSVRTGATLAPPLQDGIVPDTQVNLNNGSSGQLTPTGLEDIPDPGIPLRQLSDNRHHDDEDVGLVSPGGGGNITIAVFGYNGAFSPDAYTLRVREYTPPVTQVCSARRFDHPGDGETTDSLSGNLASIPANVNTIILVNEKRLGDTYGSTAATDAVNSLDHLATDTNLGVSGVVVPVEQIGGTAVQSLYDTWDSNPCDPKAANAVANAIANEVNSIVAAHPSIQYVVFGGGDDQIPFFRLPDLSLLANEKGFADQFGPNEYQGSLAAGDLLSDDPYLDTNPVPASGQQLFPPNLAGGRLVETAQDITNQVTAFENAPVPGELRSSTGFVSGYDFVADGSQRVANNLAANGVTTRTLIDNPLTRPLPTPFSSSDLFAAAFPSGVPADINSWNGHYDNYRAQMANGDIISTSDLAGRTSQVSGGVFFTMGCHAGFQTTDAIVGSTGVLDWPQYFAHRGTGFVGNTGFGLGDTDSVAFSEELMADFAGNIGTTTTLGNALLQAKQQYYLSRVAFSNYDEKALSEAELYGLPMYGIGHAPTALVSATKLSKLSFSQNSPSTPSPDPVHGAAASTSPNQGSLSSFPGSGVQSANFAATPHFDGPFTGQNGQYYTNAGQVQAPNYRPLQPYVSLPAARSGLLAHGVVIDGLASQDDPGTGPNGFVPDNVRPTLNTSADEPPPTFTDESWPEKIPNLVSLGANQQLNLVTGQFFTQGSGPSTTGVERKWTQIDGRVTYSTSQDYTPPTIDSINAFESAPGQSGDVLAFSGQFSDIDPTNPATGHPGTVVFAQVIYDDGTGHWHPAQLQQDQVSGLWSAGVPFSGSHVQYFVEICDAAGNCGYSSNKGNYFDAEPLPPSTVGTSLTLSPDRQPDAHGTWYTGTLHVAVASTAPKLSVTVDGVTVTPVAGQVTLSGDGAHIVDATDSDGNTVTGVYLIDTTAPTITHTISPAQPDGNNGWYKTQPTVTFHCADNLSGVASCLANGTGTDHKTVADNVSSQSVFGTATDNVGHTTPDTANVTKVDSTPPTVPTFSGIVAGQSYTATSLPPQNNITCNSSDATSGLLATGGCVVSGYDNNLGPHQLTASATDKAGNTSTSTLNYTVIGPATFTSANATIFNSGQTNTFSITTSGAFPAPAITNANFTSPTSCTKSTLPSNVTLTDNNNGTATLASTAAAMTPGNYTLCLNAMNGSGTARQKFTLSVFKTPTFAGITFVNTVRSGGGKVPDCSTKNPFGTKLDDFNAFPHPICSSDGNAPKPSTFSWEVELANGTPQKPAPVVNTGGTITVSMTAVAIGPPKPKTPLPTFLGPTSATIANGSSATTVPFKVGNIGNGNWIQVTVAVSGGTTYTLVMQVH